MSNNCGQVNIPVTDDTNLECDDFLLSTCIIVKELSSKLGNLEGENLDKLVERLHKKLSQIDNKLYSMSQDIKILKDKINILENE